MLRITKLGLFVLPLWNLCFNLNPIPIFVSGHGMMLDPPNRSSIWRRTEFKDFNATENWADNELFCGGIEMQHFFNGGRCGVCGDNFSEPIPRPNEDGGIYGKGIIVRKYKRGETIPILVNLTTSHWGFFEIRLCSRNDGASHLKESCYTENLLEIISPSNQEVWLKKQRVSEKVKDKTRANKVNSTSTTTTPKPQSRRRPTTTLKPYINITKYFLTIGISHPHDAPMQHRFHVRLPKKVRCKHCVLQWQYTTGSNWGECEDGRKERGCGPQETFRNCADITIH